MSGGASILALPAYEEEEDKVKKQKLDRLQDFYKDKKEDEKEVDKEIAKKEEEKKKKKSDRPVPPTPIIGQY